MNTDRLFRVVLPVRQTLLAAGFGGFGLWQRAQILNKPFWGDHTAWDSTARFHVWPWPYKFAAVSNLPALLLGDALSWPLGAAWRGLPEWVQLLPTLALVALLWHSIGRVISRRTSTIAGVTSYLAYVAAFMCLSLIGALVPLAYMGYIWYGGLLWIAATAFLFRTHKPKAQRT